MDTFQLQITFYSTFVIYSYTSTRVYRISKRRIHTYIYIQHTMLEDAGVESEEELVVVEQEGAGVVVVFIVILHEKMIS